MNEDIFNKTAKLIRYHLITATTRAGSGHLTSSLSAVELMTLLMFGGHFRFFVENPEHPNNDRLIFSKGHASPLFYVIWMLAGGFQQDELKTLRKFGSRLEGHPTMEFPYTEVATGSLGQGLSVGTGIALNGKYLDKLPYTTYILLGDSEMAEGSNWEAMQLAVHYKLDNLVGIIDVNRLGQRGETMYGHDLDAYKNRIEAFGWNTISVDGHNFEDIEKAFSLIKNNKNGKPTMIIAKTVKGKGIRFIEDKNGWHGKTLQEDEMNKALEELGDVDMNVEIEVAAPEDKRPEITKPAQPIETDSSYNEPLATRKAYGHALVEMYPMFPDMVVLDAEVSNSTYAELFAKAHPDRFFEMFIAEQNMVGVALGLSSRGKIPFVSTFASFFSRAVDQIRVSQYSKARINFVGSHVGVSIGEDGPTQMGLEDITTFRSVLGSVVLYPADHVADEKLAIEMARHPGVAYMRTTRLDTAPIYTPDEEFKIGGCKVLKKSENDQIAVISAGITLYEALKAYDMLQNEHINVRVIDLYSIKPLDKQTLIEAAATTKAFVTVEDHFIEGGLGEAVASAMSQNRVPIHMLAVRKMPKSGSPEELLDYEEISAPHIVAKVKDLLLRN